MQTEQPAEPSRRFTAADVTKRRVKKVGKNDLPDQTIADVLEVWVKYQGWLKPLPAAAVASLGMSEADIVNLAYRYGHGKKMLPPEEWKPGWGRRPRRKPEHELGTPQGGPSLPGWNTVALNERFRKLDERITVLGRLPLADGWLTDQDLQEKLQYIIMRSGAWDDTTADLKSYQKQATPASELSGRVITMDQEIVRLAGIIELERTANTDLLERVVRIENKLRGGGRKGPSFLTKLHREIRRRLRVLVAGGK